MTVEQRAQCALEFLLRPSNISKQTFYNQYYEKLPLYCCYNTNNKHIPTATVSTTASNNEYKKQQHTNRYTSIFSINDLQHMIQNNTMYYGSDLNVTRYEKSKHDNVYRRITLDRKKTKKKTKSHQKQLQEPQITNNNETINDDEYEIVQYNDIWDQYMNHGCTIRLLCPQQYNNTIYTLLSLLEHEFNCMVGANIYLTPPNASQGFAPHYDDIDAYIIQLEGYKRWKVYPPLEKNERLPRISSKDYTTNDLIHVTPILDIVLESGDMLYIPRGWIHQACTISNDSDTTDMTHSLHLTISTMQQWAWADYMEILVPEALNAAIQAPYITLREGLPNGFLHYMGAMYDNREELLPDVLKSKLVPKNNVNNNIVIGKGKSTNGSELQDNDDDDNENDNNDSMIIENRSRLQEEFRFQTKRRLMRVVKEAMNMIDAACDQMGKRFLSDRLPPALTPIELQKTNHSSSIQTITPDMVCQLVRPGIARFVLEDDMAILYHCNDNSRLYHEHPISPMEFEIDDAPALEQLLTTIPPNWIAISDLIHDTIDDKISIVQSLFDEGIIAIQHGLN
jgi:bifunctional lysine-specific demethylase and histidyl-hydroxylase NO66